MSYRFPQGNVFYRKLKASFPLIVRGDGVYLYDDRSKKYIDASGGAVVVNVGHGVKEIIETMADQAKKIAYVNGTQFTNEAVESLATEIAEVMPDSLNKVYPLTSGAEATEAAIKLARQFWVLNGCEDKFKVISHNPGYHGSTLGALAVSGRPMGKHFYHPLVHDFPLIPIPSCYRCPYDDKYPNCLVKCGHALESVIGQEGPETVSAFIAEPIVGASGGAVVPPIEYFEVIREICDLYQVLFIADEVLTGMGRTGKWLAMEHYGVVPDIVLLGKGLAGGYSPLSALVAREEIITTIAESARSFVHGLTFSHTPVICAAGLATIRYIKAHRLVDRCAEMGTYLINQLQQLYDFSFVGDIRGKGLLIGIEFVEDRESKRPFPRENQIAEKIFDVALENGLVLWTNVGHVDGERGDLVIVGPPFIITHEQIDEIVNLLKMTLRTVSETCP